jgi:hypothetical protein
MPGFMPGIHVFLQAKHQHCRHPEVLAVFRRASKDRPKAPRGHPSRRRASARLLRMTAECASRHACFPALLAPNKDREIGGGRATRQPGQVRKEAALTRCGSGRSSVSYLFFRANRAKADIRFALDLFRSVFRKSGTRFCDQNTHKLSSAKPASKDNQLRIDR